MRRSTQELYGVEPDAFWSLPYGEALERKRLLAKKRLKEVSNEMDKIFNEKERSEEFRKLTFLQKDIYDAIAFNEKLIDEKRGRWEMGGRDFS